MCYYGTATVGPPPNLIQALKPETQADIPAWDCLLYIYGILFVPTFFSVLIGLNLLVWAAERVNYVFIFGAWISTALCLIIDFVPSRAGCYNALGPQGLL